jgi:hypothetical protein
MAKTGERYTAARLHVVDAHSPGESGDAADSMRSQVTAAGADAGAADTPPDVDLGLSDEAVRRGSGKSWDEWFAILDAWGASEKSHTEISRHVAQTYEVEGWWSQGVTVGYERARGMRAKHQRPDGYNASASKTVSVPVATLFHAVVDEARRDGWLEPGTLSLRTATEPKSARFDKLDDGCKIGINFWPKGDAKSSIQLEHQKIASAEGVEESKAFWKERLARLAEMLEARG